MTPRITGEHLTDSCAPNTEFMGYDSGMSTRLGHFPDLRHLRGIEFCSRVPRAMRSSISTLRLTVPHIVKMGSYEQVLRIEACGVVA